MWAQKFFVNILFGFLGLFSTIGGGEYKSEVFWAWGFLGLLLVPCFLCGLYVIIRFIANRIYDIRSKKHKWRNK